MSADIQAIPRLDRVAVRGVMHAGVITCEPDARVNEIADLLAAHRVHCLVVRAIAGGRLTWGMISDMDLMRAVDAGDGSLTAAQLAATESLMIDSAESVERAARLMVEHDVSHLIVSESGAAVGVVSRSTWRAPSRPDQRNGFSTRTPA
jgi:CBS domain-containing protein